MVALDWAQRHPEEIAGVVLINTSTADTSPWSERMALSAMQKMGKIFLEPSEREREEKILELISREPFKHENILNDWVKIARERPAARTTIARQLWAASRFKLLNNGVKSPPTLCLGSLGDELVNPACSDRLAKTLQVPLRLHPWAGHEVTLDDPSWVVTEVQKWRKTL